LKIILNRRKLLHEISIHKPTHFVKQLRLDNRKFVVYSIRRGFIKIKATIDHFTLVQKIGEARKWPPDHIDYYKNCITAGENLSAKILFLFYENGFIEFINKRLRTSEKPTKLTR
jgi:hypothetical protein